MFYNATLIFILEKYRWKLLFDSFLYVGISAVDPSTVFIFFFLYPCSLCMVTIYQWVLHKLCRCIYCLSTSASNSPATSTLSLIYNAKYPPHSVTVALPRGFIVCGIQKPPEKAGTPYTRSYAVLIDAIERSGKGRMAVGYRHPIGLFDPCLSIGKVWRVHYWLVSLVAVVVR